MANYSDVLRQHYSSSKWILSVGMILGRLELFAILVLFLPSFWKN